MARRSFVSTESSSKEFSLAGARAAAAPIFSALFAIIGAWVGFLPMSWVGFPPTGLVFIPPSWVGFPPTGLVFNPPSWVGFPPTGLVFKPPSWVGFLPTGLVFNPPSSTFDITVQKLSGLIYSYTISRYSFFVCCTLSIM